MNSHFRVKTFRQVFDQIKGKYLYFWFVIAVLIITYVIPTFANPTPYGTDTYTHLYHVTRMSSTFSMEEYYDNQRKMGDESFTYPFALWLFGSIIKKITGLSIIFIGKYIPIIFLFVSLFMYYSFSKRFLSGRYQKMLAILFLISMPLTARINTYVSSSIALFFLIILLHLLYNYKFDFKIAFLFFVSAFMLTVSHVGTLMFFVNFLFLYFILSSFVKRKIDNNFFIATILTMAAYYIATFLFNEIRPQYIQKTKMVLKIGNILSKLNLEFLDISNILYENVFKNTQIIYFLFLFGILYFASMMSAVVGKKVHSYLQKHARNLILMPLAGKVPKTLAGTPIWVGIPQTIFSIIGFFRVNVEGKLIFITTFFIVLVSGSDSTNVTRKIYYLIIIVPILAAIGFYTLIKFLQKKKRKLVLPLVMLTFSSLFGMPVVLNTYFASKISGELNEREGLIWLSNYGEPAEAAEGIGFRHLISVYGNKIPAVSTVSIGSELRNYFIQRKLAYFSDDQDSIIDMLASYNVKYYLISKRSFKTGSFNYQMLEIENKSLVDKIYSNNKNFFRIYKVNYIPKIQFVEDRRSIEYEERPPVILDSGKFYLIRTENYQVKLNKGVPVIGYFGTKNENFLGLGYIYDYITWKEFGTKKKQIYGPRKLRFNVSISEDSIKYSTRIFDANQSVIFDLSIKYIFFSDVFKQEITIIPYRYGRFRIYTKIWKPTNLIITKFENKNYEERRVFPAEDSINKHLKFNKIYLQDNSTGKGIFMYQDNTFPYPRHISYRGSVKYQGYAIASIRTTEWTFPKYPYTVERFFTIANSFQDGENKIEKRKKISVYPFPNGIKPLVLLNVNENVLARFNITKFYDNQNNSYYIIGPIIGAPYKDILNYEGKRKIKIIQNNNQTEIILPICGPISEKLRILSKDLYFSSWKSQINVLSLYNEDLCGFDWKSEHMLSQEYHSDFKNLINYSIRKGFVVISPYYIINYYKLLQNVKIKIKYTNNMTKITIINNNNYTLSGFTLKISNFKLNSRDIKFVPAKEFSFKNRHESAYISFDLNANEKIYLIMEVGG